MEKNNNKRRVSRQNWKPGHLWELAHGVWTAIYAVIKVGFAALATVLLIGGVCGVVFVGVLADYLQGDILPQAGVQLEGFDLSEPSYVYYLDDAGNIQVLQKLHASIESEWAEYEEIPKEMVYAAVSIEDHRFFEHQGVDWFTTIKACVGMFMGTGDAGGSSITQQLIKNLLLTKDAAADDVTVQRKVLEIFRATEFEKRYDKEVVLEWYLNYIYLGNSCQGVKAAAEKYFGKELEDLNAAECACIISITNNPSIFNPLSDKEIKYKGEVRQAQEWNKIRREDVLWTMRNYGYLTEEEYEIAQEQSDNMVFSEGVPFEKQYSDCVECGYHAHNETFVLKGTVYHCPQCDASTTIGEDASQEVYSWFVDTVINDLAADLASQSGMVADKETLDLYRSLIARGGYHIYSTLDLTVQNSVDKIYTNLDEIPTTSSMQQLQSGICIIDKETGDIVALAGGVGEKTTHFGYNRATVDRLQPGSSMKPLAVYAPGFELGVINPSTVVSDMPIMYIGTGKFDDEGVEKVRPFPKNDDSKYRYSYTILEAITESVNASSVKTLQNMGLEYSFNYAKYKFQISGLVESYVNSQGTIFTDIALAPLGMGAPTIGVSVRDMAAAYATFINDGVWREARTYTHVYNSNGDLIMYNEQDSQRIISTKTCDYINYCLNNAVNKGTGTAARISGQNVAGKTGSTASFKDRWFCGSTGYYTAAIWCGYDTPEAITLTGSEKTNPACRLFKKVMTPLHQGKDAIKLFDETKFVEVQVCRDSGKLATEGCALDHRGSRIMKAKVYVEDMPTEYCDSHIAVDFCTECNASANEYCHKFAQVGKATITTAYLVKLTQKEVDEIALACAHGLVSSYKTDLYIYLVDDAGNPAYFHGMKGDQNVGLYYPYVVGTVHSAATWQQYLSENNSGLWP